MRIKNIYIYIVFNSRTGGGSAKHLIISIIEVPRLVVVQLKFPLLLLASGLVVIEHLTLLAPLLLVKVSSALMAIWFLPSKSLHIIFSHITRTLWQLVSLLEISSVVFYIRKLLRYIGSKVAHYTTTLAMIGKLGVHATGGS